MALRDFCRSLAEKLATDRKIIGMTIWLHSGTLYLQDQFPLGYPKEELTYGVCIGPIKSRQSKIIRIIQVIRNAVTHSDYLSLNANRAGFIILLVLCVFERREAVSCRMPRADLYR